MKVNELKAVLEKNPDAKLHIMLPGGEFVPEHFHVTEVGHVHKQFIDCGGTRREITSCVLQVWVANDTHHRLVGGKLAKILGLAASLLGDNDPVEVEWQTESISVYPLGDVEVTPQGLLLVLGSKKTACLAPDKCGVSGCC